MNSFILVNMLLLRYQHYADIGMLVHHRYVPAQHWLPMTAFTFLILNPYLFRY